MTVMIRKLLASATQAGSISHTPAAGPHPVQLRHRRPPRPDRDRPVDPERRWSGVLAAPEGGSNGIPQEHGRDRGHESAGVFQIEWSYHAASVALSIDMLMLQELRTVGMAARQLPDALRRPAASRWPPDGIRRDLDPGR